jgi:hypothetical protein
VDARSCTSPPGLCVTGCALAALHLIELVAAVKWAMLVSVMGVHVELVAEEAFGVGRGSRGTGGGGGGGGVAGVQPQTEKGTVNDCSICLATVKSASCTDDSGKNKTVANE